MLNSFLRSALIAGLVVISSGTAFAQTSALQNCKPEISATGSAAITLKGAQESAISNWRRSVVLRYGEFFATFDKADQKSADRCGKTILGLSRCEARGRPCETSSPGDRAEISCDSRNDSKNCEPLVKWVQSRLNAKLGTSLKTDGSAGRSTEEALRRFQRQNNLGSSGEIDEKTIAALR